MKKALIFILLFSASFSHAMGYPTFDWKKIQELIESQNISKDTLGQVKNIKNLVLEQNLLIGAFKAGNYSEAASVYNRMISNLNDMGIFQTVSNPKNKSETLDFSDGKSAKTIKETLYIERPLANNSGNSTPSSYVDDQNEVRRLRREAYNESITRYYTFVDQVNKDIKVLQEQIHTVESGSVNEEGQITLIPLKQGENLIEGNKAKIASAKLKLKIAEDLMETLELIDKDERVYADEFKAGG